MLCSKTLGSWWTVSLGSIWFHSCSYHHVSVSSLSAAIITSCLLPCETFGHWDSSCAMGVTGHTVCVWRRFSELCVPACWHLQTSHNSRHERKRQTREEEGEDGRIRESWSGRKTDGGRTKGSENRALQVAVQRIWNQSEHTMGSAAAVAPLLQRVQHECDEED